MVNNNLRTCKMKTSAIIAADYGSVDLANDVEQDALSFSLSHTHFG